MDPFSRALFALLVEALYALDRDPTHIIEIEASRESQDDPRGLSIEINERTGQLRASLMPEADLNRKAESFGATEVLRRGGTTVYSKSARSRREQFSQDLKN